MSEPGLAERPLIVLEPSLPRLYFGVGVTGALGVLLFSVLVTTPPAEPVWIVVLVLAGIAAFWAALALLRARDEAILLYEDRLQVRSGQLLCRVDEVAGVERGLAAFKPSGGFLVRLTRPRSAGWTPGIWWRRGRTIGVGGVTRSGEARAMADALSALAAARDGE